MLNRQVYLESIAYEVPPCVVSSASILERLSPTLERLKIPAAGLIAASGVHARRYWPAGTTIVEAATNVARRAIEGSGLDMADIGAIVSTSVCKDYIEPSMASMIHGELGLSDDCRNMDLGNACLGFMEGISMMADMIELGRIKAAVVVDAESSRDVVEATIERLLGPDVKASDLQVHFASLTLGSGAVAMVLVHQSLAKRGHRLVGQVSLADTRHSSLCLGSHHQMLVQTRQLLDAGLSLARRTFDLAQKLLGWTTSNIDFVIGHQVGAKHFKMLFEMFKLDQARSFVTYPFLGNIGPASVPLTLAMAVERGLVKPGYRLGLMGIGSGLNCSMMQIDW